MDRVWCGVHTAFHQVQGIQGGRSLLDSLAWLVKLLSYSVLL